MKIKIAKKVISYLLSDPKGRKVLACCIAAIFFINIIIPAAAISLPGLVVKGFFSKVASFISGGDEEVEISDDDIESMDDYEFVLEESDIFKDVKAVYLKYNDDLNNKIEEKIAKIQKDNTYTKKVPKTDLETGEPILVEEEVVPEVIKNIDLEKPRIQYVLAYITTKYLSIQTEDDPYEFDEKETKEFLDEITTLYESTEGTDPITYTAYTVISDEYEIMGIKFSEKEYPDEYEEKQEQYLVSYESFLDLDDEQIDGSYNSNTGNLDIDLSDMQIYANGMEIPHFLQYDSRWGSVPYGGKYTIAFAGCGITSMAMILNYYGYKITPIELASWVMDNGHYTFGVGTSWSFFPAISKKYDIECTVIGKDPKKLIKALEEGKPVIASMAPGTFTDTAHFIVLRGITAEGKILVNDPNDNTRKKNFYKREFDIKLIINESKNMWTFSK